MDDIKAVVASNIIELRTKFGMTQLELAEKLNYSDKSVSKWERAESIPDVTILKSIADIFGVTVDYLINPHEEYHRPRKSISYRTITQIAIAGIWTLALLLFIIFWLMGNVVWLILLYAVPVSIITLLVLNSIWERGRHNYLIIGALILSLFICVYFSFFRYNWWQIFILAVPAEFIVYLCFRLKKNRK